MIDRIKKKAEELLRTKQVDLIIGYKRAPDGVSVAPVFIDKAEEIGDMDVRGNSFILNNRLEAEIRNS